MRRETSPRRQHSRSSLTERELQRPLLRNKDRTPVVLFLHGHCRQEVSSFAKVILAVAPSCLPRALVRGRGIFAVDSRETSVGTKPKSGSSKRSGDRNLTVPHARIIKGASASKGEKGETHVLGDPHLYQFA